MAWTRAKRRRSRTVPLALLLTTLSERPRNQEELERLFDAQATPEHHRVTLRRAFRDGFVVFYVLSLGSYATRESVLSENDLTNDFVGALRGVRFYLRTLAASLVAGEIDISEFERRAREEIEQAIHDAAMLIAGPLYATMGTLMALVLDAIGRQMQWLSMLVADILSGRQPLNSSLLRRLSMYAGAGWSSLQEMQQMMALQMGYTQERNILAPAEHCGGCLEETGKGWVPIGTLVPVGSRDCLSNCLCHLEFR